jgi:hypothetical protein
MKEREGDGGGGGKEVEKEEGWEGGREGGKERGREKMSEYTGKSSKDKIVFSLTNIRIKPLAVVMLSAIVR